ncbi:helix-turn-helix domain-containing protein [uncultured Phocaeicola sp.]|jgi:transcriptional regulator with XRE-family HTH domain|nr:helix-turn-helix domain-containing protein [uncultured Phocaeicola sp.]
MIDIAEVVSKRKDELSISFQEIAKRSGLTDSSVKRIADGTTKNPKIGNLALISQALEMPFEKFLKECGYFSEDGKYDF